MSGARNRSLSQKVPKSRAAAPAAVLVTAIATVVTIINPGRSFASDDPRLCQFPQQRPGTIVRIISERMFDLDNGTRIRLADIAAILPVNNPPHAVATLSGMPITYWPLTDSPDRHGAVLVYARPRPKGQSSPPHAQALIQQQLIDNKRARASADPIILPNPEHRAIRAACLRNLLSQERQGAAEQHSIPASDATELARRTGQFVTIVGTIRRISSGTGRRQGRRYLNFGTNWKTDTTVVIPRTLQSAWPDWGTTLSSLKGKTVHVRGWLSNNNGPLMTLDHPAMLEHADSTSQTPDPVEPTTAKQK